MSENIPDDVIALARKYIAEEVSPAYRYFYMSGRADGCAAMRAVCKAILNERFTKTELDEIHDMAASVGLKFIPYEQEV